MATFSTGISATFGSYTLLEMVGLSWNWGGGMPAGRGLVWQSSPGQVTIESLSPITTAMYGMRDVLRITGGDVDLTTPAVCTDIAATAELNGVSRYAYTFDILDN